MTETQATALQANWDQQGDPPLCEHPTQELGRLLSSDDGYLMGTYYCRECGEEIVYIRKIPAVPL